MKYIQGSSLTCMKWKNRSLIRSSEIYDPGALLKTEPKIYV